MTLLCESVPAGIQGVGGHSMLRKTLEDCTLKADVDPARRSLRASSKNVADEGNAQRFAAQMILENPESSSSVVNPDSLPNP